MSNNMQNNDQFTMNQHANLILHRTDRSELKSGVTINRPPRDGHMAFVRSPDNISIEILQEGESLSPQEPWLSMENTGSW